MSKEKVRNLMNAYFTSQFGLCHLIWMFHGRTLNNRKNNLQARTSSLVCNNNALSFSELLKRKAFY